MQQKLRGFIRSRVFTTITFLDWIYVNVKREGRVEKTTMYVVLAVDLEGRKDVLRHWVGDGAEGEVR